MFTEDRVTFLPIDKVSPIVLNLIGHSYCDGTYRIARVNFPFYIFEYIISGYGYLRIGDKSYTPQKGDVYIVPQHVAHEYSSSSDDPWIKVWFNVGGPLITFLLEQYQIADVHLFRDMSSSVRDLFEAGVEELSENRADALRLAPAVMTKIIVELSMNYRNQLSNISHEAYAIQQLLNKNIRNPDFSIDDAARQLRYSRSQILRIFSRDFKTSPYQYLLNQRLALAGGMLKNTSIPLKEIASSLGFNDVFYFSYIFKKKSGIAPAHYRIKSRMEAKSALAKAQKSYPPEHVDRDEPWETQ